MDPLLTTAGLVLAAVSTPGPNNLAVAGIAARSGIGGAVPALIGIVSGSLALLFVVFAGAASLLEANSWLRTLLALLGSAYLAWLGLRMVTRSLSRTSAEPTSDVGLPATGPALFVFQFLNPKAWVLVATVSTAIPGSPSSWFPPWPLVLIFSIVPTLCLLVWSWLGYLTASLASEGGGTRALERTMGLLLMASAILLAVRA